MPKLACWKCGRQLYAVAPLEALFAEERRCPRCGESLAHERRTEERRQGVRRRNPPDDPGPPVSGERRVADRRAGKRRRDDSGANRPPGRRPGERPG